MKHNYIILGVAIGTVVGWLLRKQYWLTRFGMSDAGVPR